jgi:hypothetical protein
MNVDRDPVHFGKGRIRAANGKQRHQTEGSDECQRIGNPGPFAETAAAFRPGPTQFGRIPGRSTAKTRENRHYFSQPLPPILRVPVRRLWK